jgi:ribonuclease P protein component
MGQLITIKKTKTSGPSCLFFVISKKNIIKATERSLVRRRFRAIFKPFLQKPGFVYTVIVHKGAEKSLFSELKEAALEKINKNE